MLELMVDSAIILNNLLTASQYHDIRENLGKTSGSHSEELRKKLFLNNWPKLNSYIDKNQNPPHSIMLCRQIGILLNRWKTIHLNLPRKKLGQISSGVRSLTGSTDAVRTVEAMRRAAEQQNSLKNKVANFELPPYSQKLEQRLLQGIAKTVMKRFKDVQNRTGYFKD